MGNECCCQCGMYSDPGSPEMTRNVYSEIRVEKPVEEETTAKIEQQQPSEAPVGGYEPSIIVHEPVIIKHMNDFKKEKIVVAKDMPKIAKSIAQKAALLEAHLLNKNPPAELNTNERKDISDQYIKVILEKPTIKTRTKTKISRVNFPTDTVQ